MTKLSPVVTPSLMMLLALLLLSRAAQTWALCTGVVATLTLDWNAENGRRADQATAEIVSSYIIYNPSQVNRGTNEVAVSADGKTVCAADDFEGNPELDDYYGYVSICRYCLEVGDYDLILRDSWGDGWDAGKYTLALDGCNDAYVFIKRAHYM